MAMRRIGCGRRIAIFSWTISSGVSRLFCGSLPAEERRPVELVQSRLSVCA
jgi:hypothetical protein